MRRRPERVFRCLKNSIWRSRFSSAFQKGRASQAAAAKEAAATIWPAFSAGTSSFIFSGALTSNALPTVTPLAAEMTAPTAPNRNAANSTPAIVARTSPCVLCEDLACTRACPSGALLPLDAGRCAAEAVKWVRKNPDYLAMLASAKLREKDAKGARSLVDEALKLDPENGRAKQLRSLMGSGRH